MLDSIIRYLCVSMCMLLEYNQQCYISSRQFRCTEFVVQLIFVFMFVDAGRGFFSHEFDAAGQCHIYTQTIRLLYLYYLQLLYGIFVYR